MSEPTTTPPVMRVQRTADHRIIYANQTLLTYSGSDIQVTLGTSSYIDGQPVIEQHSVLYLAPAQAKFLAMALQKAVENHEREFGSKVVVPTSMTDWVRNWGPVE